MNDEELIEFLAGEGVKERVLAVFGWDAKSLDALRIKNAELTKFNASLLAKIPSGEPPAEVTPEPVYKGDVREIFEAMNSEGKVYAKVD